VSVKSLRTLATAVEAFRALDAEMQSQQIVTFLMVAAAGNDHISMRQLADHLGIASSSVSRNVAALSEHHRLGHPGHNLVEAYEDPADRRNKRVRLTAKGRTLAARLQQITG
jgi:DNA-binding MarR family transcriptional regulator